MIFYSYSTGLPSHLALPYGNSFFSLLFLLSPVICSQHCLCANLPESIPKILLFYKISSLALFSSFSVFSGEENYYYMFADNVLLSFQISLFLSSGRIHPIFYRIYRICLYQKYSKSHLSTPQKTFLFWLHYYFALIDDPGIWLVNQIRNRTVGSLYHQILPILPPKPLNHPFLLSSQPHHVL